MQQALKQVFTKNYVAIALLTAIVIFCANAIVKNFTIITKSFSLQLIYELIKATPQTMATTPLVLLTTISLLGGIVIALSIYTIKRQIKSDAKMGTSAIILSILIPACPSCAVGVVGILGIGGLITALPFKGLELGALTIILLLISTVYLTKKVATTQCKI